MRVSRWFAAQLETGSFRGYPGAHVLSKAYEAVASTRLARPVTLPARVRVVGVGSAVLGGAGKTLVAIAYARRLAQAGMRVSFVGHGYGAHPREARCCEGDETVLEIGDDALLAMRALRPYEVGVWVGKDRNEVLAKAASGVDVIVVDGLLQTRPCELFRSVLVVDGQVPFGSGACPPLGDLRGSVRSLIGHCDEVVVVRDVLSKQVGLPTMGEGVQRRQIRTAWIDWTGLRMRGQWYSMGWLEGRRVGLATLMAHPERVLASLRRRGVEPVCVWQGPDHGSVGKPDLAELLDLSRYYRIEGWIVTTKCVTHFEKGDVGAPCFCVEVASHLDPDPLPVVDSGPWVPQSL